MEAISALPPSPTSSPLDSRGKVCLLCSLNLFLGAKLEMGLNNTFGNRAAGEKLLGPKIFLAKNLGSSAIVSFAGPQNSARKVSQRLLLV